MPVLQQQESRTPVDERVHRHLEEKLKPAVCENFSAAQFVGTSRRSSSNQLRTRINCRAFNRR